MIPASTLPVAPNTVDLSSLRQQLRDFYDDYAQCLDDDRLEAWVDYFVEDCHYRVIHRENHRLGLPLGLIYCMNKNMVRDRVTALRQTTVFQPRVLRHFISGVRVNALVGEEIHAQANVLITECLCDGEPSISLAGQYLDVLVPNGAGFLFKRRECIVDNYRINTSLIMPV